MKKGYFTVLIMTFFLISCSINNAKKMYNDEIKYIEIKNNRLIKNINAYCSEVLNEVNFEFALILDVNEKKDSNQVDIYYEMNLSSLASSVPLFYTEIDDVVVFIKNKPIESEVVSKIKTDSLLMKVFKRQYNHYSNNGEYPPPITFGSEKWTFIDDELTSKGLH